MRFASLSFVGLVIIKTWKRYMKKVGKLNQPKHKAISHANSIGP